MQNVMNTLRSRKIVDQMRSFLDKYSTSNQQYVNLIDLGKIEETDLLGSSLHRETINGNRRALKKVLQSAIFVDYPNDKGQTPLFSACARNVENTALLLLQHGANPNEKSFEGLTPAHAACYLGNVRLLGKLIEAGADLRLHDNEGRSVRDWALLNPDPSARSRMIDFIDRTHTYAMTFSGDAVSLDRFTKYARRSHKKTSLMEIMRMRTGSDTSFDNLKRVQSMGFGKVYLGTDHSGGIMSVIPMISESVLYSVPDSRFDTGPVSFMEKMTWLKTMVTVKQVNPDIQQNDGIDLLITDAEFLGKIRHPNVLLLMAITQSTNFDTLMLVFENVKHDNLYHFLHQKGHRLSPSQQMALVIQVSSAMEFIHSQSLIHCGLSSMAIYLVSENYFKVGNFEYMVESIKANVGRISLVSTAPHGQQLYNWMAPELIVGNAPCFASDVFSFSCIVWELFTGEIPWEGLSPEAIRHKVVESGRTLDINLARLPLKLKSLISYGLVLRHDERLQKFTNILEWLSPELYGSDSRGKNRSGNFAAHSKHSSPPSSTADEDRTDWTMDLLHFTPGLDSVYQRHISSLGDESPAVTESETKDSCPFSVDTSIASNEASSKEAVHNQGTEMLKGLKVKPASHFSHQTSALLPKPCGGGSLGQLHCGENKPRAGCGDGRSSTLPRKSASRSRQISSSENVLHEPATSRTNIVKILTQNFQMQLNQHHLRQAILKGSMAPKGTADVYFVEAGPDDSGGGFDVGKRGKEVNKSSSLDLGNLSSTPVAKCTSTPKDDERIVTKSNLDSNEAPVQDPRLIPKMKTSKDNDSEQHSDFDKGDCKKLEKTGKSEKIQGKLNECTMNDTSGHQAFLDEIMLVHAQIVQRSKRWPSSGTTYQSPLVQVCHSDLSDPRVVASCPKSDAFQERHKTTLSLDGKASGDLSYLSDDLNDSFWNLLPDVEKCQRFLAGAEPISLRHDKTFQLSPEPSEYNGLMVASEMNSLIPENQKNEGKVSGEEILSGDHMTARTKSEVFVKPDSMTLTFTCKSSSSDIFTTLTPETNKTSPIKVSNLSKAESRADGNNPAVNGAAGLDQVESGGVCDFDYLEFYIDDDFVCEERVKKTTAVETILGAKPADSSFTLNNPVKKEEHPMEVKCLFQKPPIVPCKSFMMSNAGYRGNMSQSALTEEEKLKTFPPKRCKSEKDVAISDAQSLPGLKKVSNLIPKAREGVPVKPAMGPCTSTNSLKLGKSDPSLSRSLADERKILLPDKDDDTLVEVDGDTLAEDVVPLAQSDKAKVTSIEMNDEISVGKRSPLAKTAVATASKSNRLVQADWKNQTFLKEAYVSNDYLQNQTLLKNVHVRNEEWINEDSDPWVCSRLRHIQEKLRRRKARGVYLVSSDDDTDNDVSSAIQMSSSESEPLPVTWEISDLLLDVTDPAPISTSRHEREKQKTVTKRNASPHAHRESAEDLNDPQAEQQNRVETQSVATSTTGLQYKKHKKKSSRHRDKMPENEKVTEYIAPDRHHETRPPSILRKFSHRMNSFCKDSDKMGTPSPLPRMKSNLSTSHGSRSSDRIISFKDVRESDKPRSKCLKQNSGIIPPLAVEEEAAAKVRPVPAERSHGHYSSTVTTWLERQNFEESVSVNSPCLNGGRKSTSFLVDGQCISKSENEASSRNSKHSLSQKPSLADAAIKKKSDHSFSKPSSSAHDPASQVASRPAEECCSASVDKPDGPSSKHRNRVPQSRKMSTARNSDEHCVTFELNTPGRHLSKTKNATPLSSTGIHRFYIPRDLWPNGCRTRLDVRPSTTHPDCQRVTTTALNTATGESETLLDQIIPTRRLKTTIQID